MLWASLLITAVLGCTYFTLDPAPGHETAPGYSISRSQELGGRFFEKSWSVRTHPVGERMGWSKKFGFVGLDARLMKGLGNIADIISEGMNTEGLTISALVLNTSKYQAISKEKNSDREIVLWSELLPFALGRYASVNETIQALQNDLTIINPTADIPVLKHLTFGVHWGLADAHGDHAVVQYLDGKLSYTLNGVGVLTNDPPYAWHMWNLNNYVNLNPRNVVVDPSMQGESNTEAGLVPRVIGHGQNTLGLPGDYTPPGRFVRAYYLRQIALANAPPRSAIESLALSTSILDAVMIPRGVVTGGAKPGLVGRLFGHKAMDYDLDFTQWTVLKLPKVRTFLYRTYLNSQWKSIDLTKLKLAMGDTPKSIQLFDGSNGVAVADASFRLN